MPTANVGALVGREREVELLGRLLEGVLRGATETVVIEGEAGIGEVATAQRPSRCRWRS